MFAPNESILQASNTDCTTPATTHAQEETSAAAAAAPAGGWALCKCTTPNETSLSRVASFVWKWSAADCREPLGRPAASKNAWCMISKTNRLGQSWLLRCRNCKATISEATSTNIFAVWLEGSGGCDRRSWGFPSLASLGRMATRLLWRKASTSSLNTSKIGPCNVDSPKAATMASHTRPNSMSTTCGKAVVGGHCRRKVEHVLPRFAGSAASLGLASAATSVRNCLEPSSP
mmetsp:Transcript_9592/g.23159  ORF Transcript_9592/g.23159 Transcript_9592/m.23159 type:complete len:232 (+) Transcript_9592:1472-2167(+)